MGLIVNGVGAISGCYMMQLLYGVFDMSVVGIKCYCYSGGRMR